MAYSTFDATKPDPGTQAGTAFGNSINTNTKALRDALMMGAMQGFAFSTSVGTGTAAQPQYFLWTNGATILRATNTWGSGGVTDGCLTQQIWELSINSGGLYEAIATQGTTFDGSGNLTATTNAGGLLTWFLSKLAPLKKVVADLATHIGLQGVNVHGLGTMSTQASSSVSISGGSMSNVAIGNSGAQTAYFLRAVEVCSVYSAGLNAGVSLNWIYGASAVTTSGTNALTFTSVPSSVYCAVHTVQVDKFNAVTWPASVSWGAAGAPSLGAVEAIISLVTFNGGTNVRAILVWNA